MKFWNKIVSFFKGILSGSKKLLYIVYTETKKSIADVLNDPELQQLALEAVKQAALAKLQGNDAWEQAYRQFAEAAKLKGRNLGTAILETILQNVYVVYKFTEGNAVGEAVEKPSELTD
jgi:hypothetical protein